MNIELRRERPQDYRAVENLTREAFWGHSGPSCDEHYLAHRLRESPGFVPELDYVAVSGGRIVGNVMYSLAWVVDDGGARHQVLNFGPLSVLPALQGKGIGSALMRHTIAQAKRLGHRAIVFFGHPDYYPRFGFRRAAEFGILPEGGGARDAHMAMPLFDGALDGISGRFYEDTAFTMDPAEAIAFGARFPPKEEAVLPGIEVLLDRLPSRAQASIRAMVPTVLCHLKAFSGREIAAWEGIGLEERGLIDHTLRDYNYPAKVWP